MQYAKPINEELLFPTNEDFIGIPNWQENDSALRQKDYMPIINMPEEADGKKIVIDNFTVTHCTEIRTEPRPVVVEEYDEAGEKTGEHTAWEEKPITFDTSYITVTEWHYEDVPVPHQPIVISKGDFIEALIKTGLYETIKAIYEQDIDMQIFFAGFQYIDLDYTLTQEFIKKYPDIFTKQNIDAIIKEMTA